MTLSENGNVILIGLFESKIFFFQKVIFRGEKTTDIHISVCNLFFKNTFAFYGSNLYQNVLEATGCHIFV